jgi:hypothetical protein
MSAFTCPSQNFLGSSGHPFLVSTAHRKQVNDQPHKGDDRLIRQQDS